MYLGIDIGTSAVKAVLVDDHNAVLDQASAPLAISRPRPLWSEQNPADWWAATKRAVSALDARRRSAVRAIGLSGQMHGATLLDHDLKALRPAILWNDGRSGHECNELERAVPALPRITGNRAMPGFTAPKLLWVQRHEPEVFAATAMVLLPKDYIRLQMTGDCASDLSDSAGTLWLDVAKRSWSEEMLSATALSPSQMPTLYEGSAVTGVLRSDVAQAWGVPSVPVAAGGGDNAAGAIGVGVVHAGDAFLSLGTSGVLFLASDGYHPNPSAGVHTFCHAIPRQWHQMAVILSAASCLDWAARICGLGGAGAVLGLAARRARPSDNELFLPYLSGERTPHNDPNARGVLFGLTHDSDSAAIAQSVLEGIAFAFRDGMDALLAGGVSINSISVIGGGARSAYWGSILSSVLRRPLTYRDAGTVGPAYGAARLARLAIGAGTIDEVCTAPPVLDIVVPDEKLAEQYAHKFGRYQRLYHNLTDLFWGTAP